jgi:hypothetical protein
MFFCSFTSTVTSQNADNAYELLKRLLPDRVDQFAFSVVNESIKSDYFELFSESDGFRFDLVNMTRQVLANYGRVLYKNMQDAFDIATGKMEERKITRNNDGISISLQSAVSAVFLPLPECPALPVVEQNVRNVVSGDSVKLKVSLFEPWRMTGHQTDINDIQLFAPGFEITKYVKGEEIICNIQTSPETCGNDYFYTIKGNCLKAKRWFTVY